MHSLHATKKSKQQKSIDLRSRDLRGDIFIKGRFFCLCRQKTDCDESSTLTECQRTELHTAKCKSIAMPTDSLISWLNNGYNVDVGVVTGGSRRTLSAGIAMRTNIRENRVGRASKDVTGHRLPRNECSHPDWWTVICRIERRRTPSATHTKWTPIQKQINNSVRM